MADPYNDSGNQPFGTIIALPPAPQPPRLAYQTRAAATLAGVAPPAAPSSPFPSLDIKPPPLDMNRLTYQTGAAAALSGVLPPFSNGTNQPAPGVVQPANAASTPAQSPALQGIVVTAADGNNYVTPAPSFSANIATAAPQQRATGQSPQIGADGQWDVPPLPGGEPGGGGDDGGAYAGQGTWAAAAMARQGGGMSAGGGYAGVGSGRLIDPEGRINAGFDRQNATASDFMNKALDYIQGGGNIFERATRGRAIGNILHAVMGPNNVGQVQGQGVDSLNNANASIEGSENYAGATRYSSDNALTGNLVNSSLEKDKLDTDSVVMGSDIRQDPYTHMGMVVPVYGQRPQRAGQSPTAYDAAPQKGKPQEGATGKTPDGRKTVYKNGQWALAE